MSAKTSYAHIDDDWYVACRADALKAKPKAITILGIPMVLFRTSGGVGALLDRCPHRNVPLSKGAVSGDRLACGYHGWQFDIAGRCRHIPCLIGESDKKARQAPSYPTRERDGFIWVFPQPGAAPAHEPFAFPFMDDHRYILEHADIEFAGTVHAAAENALDVPHTAYLHGGLFRKAGAKTKIDVVIKRDARGCEAEYIGEAAPTGILGKVLAPGGGGVRHFDRFFLPSITQVEYRLGEDSHLLITSALTPITRTRTKLYGTVAFRSPLPIKRSMTKLLRPVAKIVLKQDADMLRLQADAVREFHGEQLISTDVDVLGPHILRLLKDREMKKTTKATSRETTMLV